MELKEVPCCTSTITAIAVILLTIIYYYVKNRKILPGPWGIPYLGLYPFLDNENVHLKLDEYKKKYGDLFSFTYSGRLYINMGSTKSIREIHVNNAQYFAEKFSEFNVISYMLENGLFMINGEAWKVVRKFFVQRMRDYGLHTIKDNMAEIVDESINATLKDLKTLGEKPVNIVELLLKRCTGMMRKVIFGEEGATDEELRQMISAYGDAVEGMAGTNCLLIGPFGRLIYTVSPKHRRFLKRLDVFAKLLKICISRIKRSMNEDQPSCLIEDYFKERNERRRKNDPTWKYFTDETLTGTVLQFIGDGALGVSGLISAFMHTLIRFPEEQDKLYAELMEVVGPNRQPTVEDKAKLSYLNAFLNEALRATSFINMFPSVECTKECTIRGYKIPKGAITLPNFYSAHHDTDTYEDPFAFKPTRYLPQPGKPKPEPPVLFGMGKRSCSGEPFVMTQSFLFLTTIIKNFKILPAKNVSNLSVDFLLTGKLELILKPRV